MNGTRRMGFAPMLFIVTFDHIGLLSSVIEALPIFYKLYAVPARFALLHLSPPVRPCELVYLIGREFVHACADGLTGAFPRP